MDDEYGYAGNMDWSQPVDSDAYEQKSLSTFDNGNERNIFDTKVTEDPLESKNYHQMDTLRQTKSAPKEDMPLLNSNSESENPTTNTLSPSSGTVNIQPTTVDYKENQEQEEMLQNSIEKFPIEPSEPSLPDEVEGAGDQIRTIDYIGFEKVFNDHDNDERFENYSDDDCCTKTGLLTFLACFCDCFCG
ncbi:uncharacterized protein LOC106659077 [Trichogramma pretiosum]|uniref:uncharacterized protein LOC106659077 n=1 Tax=Trichogramma pretiosum TaxID=7493 RepID=UPI0006C98896|nr:uncharacterized protein LOC106659077 [Trichogramma pretiosum]